MSDPQVDESYVWPPVSSRDDYKRGRIDDDGHPFVDGHRVTVAMYTKFRHEWVEYYDSIACGEPNCDGERGHDGPHHAWTSE